MLPVFSYLRLLQVYRVRLGPFLVCPVPTGHSGIRQRGRGGRRHNVHFIPDERLSDALPSQQQERVCLCGRQDMWE